MSEYANEKLIALEQLKAAVREYDNATPLKLVAGESSTETKYINVAVDESDPSLPYWRKFIHGVANGITESGGNGDLFESDFIEQYEAKSTASLSLNDWILSLKPFGPENTNFMASAPGGTHRFSSDELSISLENDTLKLIGSATVTTTAEDSWTIMWVAEITTPVDPPTWQGRESNLKIWNDIIDKPAFDTYLKRIDLTQEEYDALPEKDPYVVYVVSTPSIYAAEIYLTINGNSDREYYVKYDSAGYGPGLESSEYAAPLSHELISHFQNEWLPITNVELWRNSNGVRTKVDSAVITEELIDDGYGHLIDTFTVSYDIEPDPDPMRGSAYAVLDSEGTLTLFRSENEYAAGEGQTVTDIDGNTYTGEVFVGVENTDTTAASVPWDSKRTSILKVDIADGQTIKPAQTAYWFYGCSNVTEIDLIGLNTSNVEKMSSMFSNCSSLTSLDVTNFDTSSVKNMSTMFYNCASLSTLDVTNFDTSKVTLMGQMFRGCASLTTLDISNFDTSNVTEMGSMFHSCTSLTTLDISNFDTSNVTNMNSMFYNCSSLTSLDATNLGISKVATIAYMFYGCFSLTTIYANDWYNAAQAIESTNMFYDCILLPGYDATKTDWQMARIQPDGYFTNPATKPTN